MKHTRTTRKALFASVLSLLLCVSMLIGSTFAWFTDVAESTGNKIQAGTLQVELWEGETNISNSKTQIFNYENWEPGYSEYTDLTVKNVGSLAIKYQLVFQNIVTTGDADITEVLDVTVGDKYIGTLKEVYDTTVLATGELLAGTEVKLDRITVKMQETAGNDYQGCGITFDVQLRAIQHTYEADGFGNTDYDAGAKFPEIAREELDDQAETVINGTNISATIPVNAGLTVEGGGSVEDGETLVLDFKPTTVNTNVTVTEEEAKVETYEITLTTSGGEAVTATTPITVEINIGAGRTGAIKLYHYETPMDSKYDPETGILSFEATNFSPFTVVETFAAKIGNVGYDTLDNAIKAAVAGDTIIILEDSVEFPVITKNNLTFKTLIGTKVTKMANTSAVGVGTTFDGFEFTVTGPCVAKDLTVRNCTFTGTNGIYYGACSGAWLIENCVFNNKVYGLQIGEGSGTVNVNNTTFVGGFNTFGSGFELTFNKCNFTTVNANGEYAVFQTHSKMTIRDSVFDASWPTDYNEDGTDNGSTYVGNAKDYAVTEIYNTTYKGGSIFALTSANDGGIFVIDPTKDESGLYTGGNFLAKPADDKIATGYAAVENADKTYFVKQLFKLEGDTVTLVDPTAFETALNAVPNDGKLILPAGNYTMVKPTANVTIVGSKDVVMSLPNGVNGDGKTIAFKGITVNGCANTDWYTTQLKGAAKAIYEDCTINDLITLYCPSDFTNCVFNNTSTASADWYSVFAYGTDCNIENCTFNTTASKAIKLYSEGSQEATLNVSNCEFNGTFFDKAAIEIDSTNTTKYTVNITNCETNEYYTKLWNDKSTKSTVTVDGEVQG